MRLELNHADKTPTTLAVGAIENCAVVLAVVKGTLTGGAAESDREGLTTFETVKGVLSERTIAEEVGETPVSETMKCVNWADVRGT